MNIYIAIIGEPDMEMNKMKQMRERMLGRNSFMRKKSKKFGKGGSGVIPAGSMKMFMNMLPENYTPAKPMPGTCSEVMPKMLPKVAKRYTMEPSGLGMAMLNKLAALRFDEEHNENGKGVQIEEVGNDIGKAGDMIKQFEKLLGGK